MSKDPPFKRVANALRAEILRGDLAPGTPLPSEHSLEERFTFSRATIRKGLALLKAEGLVNSHQGKASTVRERPRVDLRQTGATYRARRATGVANYNAEAQAQGRKPLQVIKSADEEPADGAVAERFGLATGTPVVVRRLLFTVDEMPMQLVAACFPVELARGTRLAEPKKIKGGADAYLEEISGRRIVQFVEDLDVRMPVPEETEELQIPSGVPVARVLRTAYDAAGEPLGVLDSLIPCDRHKFRYVIDV